ncbi:MAG TPA: NAD(P)-binding protein [Anaerolineaceae bacterium]
MKLIQDAIFKDRYDVIVIGAGLGGMTAASLLAKRKLSVLMIDQQDKPGGSCTSFRRDGVTFDVGTAMLYGFGQTGFKPFRFLINELEEPVEVIPHATLARMTFAGQPVLFWPDVEQYLEELDQLFPTEKAGLRSFYRDLYKMYENIVLKNEIIVPPSEFTARQGLRSLMTSPVQMIRMQKLLTTSVRSLLDRYFHTPEVINFFDKLCSAYCYCTADETPAVLAATMFLDNHIGGVYYPAGGAQMLPNKIEKAFERLGGQVLYRHLVDEILIHDGQAYGVRLQNGAEILAERIIANATVWNLYGKLVRPQHIQPERLEWARSLEPTFPSMTLYMVVDRAALPASVLPWEVFIENRAVIDSGDLTLYINALVDETLCPPDKLVITAIAPNLDAWPAPGDPQYKTAAYREQKQAHAQKMLDQVEQHFPGFCKHIETLIIGTPSTIERYLLKNGGAVGGPKNKIGQEMLKRLHARSDWKNLYVCGDSTVMATGAPATVVSGVGAANRVLQDLRLPDYDTRSFPHQYVQFVEPPYTRPEFDPHQGITDETAWLAAAQCQGCEHPACGSDCPAAIDIPNVLRRIEAKNYSGAAHELRQRNPFGELCGTACPARELCERRCYRRSFTGKPVMISELMRWVSQAAGVSGWLRPEGERSGRAAVLGGGLSALTCAYYLALTGIEVDVFDPPGRTENELVAIQSDIELIKRMGVHYHNGQTPHQWPDHAFQAVYVASAGWTGPVPAAGAVEKVNGVPKSGRATPAHAIAEGRRAAFALAAQLAGED